MLVLEAEGKKTRSKHKWKADSPSLTQPVDVVCLSTLTMEETGSSEMSVYLIQNIAEGGSISEA